MKLSLLINKKMLAFSYLSAEKLSCAATFSKKEFAIVIIGDLLAGQISCSLSWAWKSFITLEPGMAKLAQSSRDNYQTITRHIGLGGSDRLRVRPTQGRQHSFLKKIDHEIFSTAILSLPLIQARQLSVSGETCILLVNRLEDWACPVREGLGKLTALDMTPLGWLVRKTSTQANKGLAATTTNKEEIQQKIRLGTASRNN